MTPARTRCAVLGDPIGHSLSPTLHRAAYAELGLLDWTYGAVAVPAGGLRDFVAALPPDWRGLSLTMPLKREAPVLADRLDDLVAVSGAANTLIVDDTGIAAYNTDIPGFRSALRERYGGPVASADVLGGGATATSALIALAGIGCRECRLFVRDETRAAPTLAAAGNVADRLTATVYRLDEAPGLPPADVVVSTIPAAAQAPWLVDWAKPAPCVFEVLYDPWPTPLAQSAAGVLVGGLDLLVHQAVLQVQLMTGRTPSIDGIRAAGEQELRRRS